MTWSWRAVALRQVVALSVLGGLAGALIAGRYAELPSLTSNHRVQVPLLAMAALLPTVAVVRGWHGLPPEVLASAARPVQAALVALMAIGTVLSGTVALALAGPGTALELARDVLGLSCLAACGWRVGGRAAAVLTPMGYLITSFLAGQSPVPFRTWWWAWSLRDPQDRTAAFVVLALVIAALWCLAARPSGRALEQD